MRTSKVSSTYRLLFLTLLSVSFSLFNSANAMAGEGEGKQLYQANCAKCHMIDRKMTGPALQQAWGKLTTRQRSRLALWWRSGGFVPTGQLSGQPMPQQAADAAQQLFAVLRHFDHLGADQIWVETPPDSPEWDGVRDRLQRAAAS